MSYKPPHLGVDWRRYLLMALAFIAGLIFLTALTHECNGQESDAIRPTLRQQVADLLQSRKEIRQEQAEMRGWFDEWQKERTERKRIQVEIEKHRLAAEVAASEAREANANNRIWRFGMVAAICLTLTLAIFKR